MYPASVVMLAPIHFTCTICPSLASTYIYTCMLLCQPSSHNVRSTKPLLPTLHASASRSVAQHTLHAHTEPPASKQRVPQHGKRCICGFRVILPRTPRPRHVRRDSLKKKEKTPASCTSALSTIRAPEPASGAKSPKVQIQSKHDTHDTHNIEKVQENVLMSKTSYFFDLFHYPPL